LKKRFKAHKLPFIIGDTGGLKELGEKGIANKCRLMKLAHIDAVSVELKSKEDWKSLPGVYSQVKKHKMYLLGSIKNIPAHRKEILSLDGVKTSLDFYKNNTLLNVCQRDNVPLFIYVSEKDRPQARILLKKIGKKYSFPLVFMAKDPHMGLFSFLNEIRGRNAHVYTGYKDATEGIVSALLALAWGGQFIEKKIRLGDISTSRTDSYSIPEFKIFSALLEESKKYLH
jgi:hypothetical protein